MRGEPIAATISGGGEEHILPRIRAIVSDRFGGLTLKGMAVGPEEVQATLAAIAFCRARMEETPCDITLRIPQGDGDDVLRKPQIVIGFEYQHDSPMEGALAYQVTFKVPALIAPPPKWEGWL